MEIKFNKNLFASIEVRAINIELSRFLSEKSLPSAILQDERKLIEALFDRVASQGQKGNALTLLKQYPDLKNLIHKNFRSHVEAGNLVNIENYQKCFDELKVYDKELINIANGM
ncbi:MAG TPA: hypothetical protein VNF06_00385, partial [Candidatus Aquilonibacter sp.]|nr:hypothetical protein [Candidatus Aquilonibacter sp.]